MEAVIVAEAEEEEVEGDGDLRKNLSNLALHQSEYQVCFKVHEHEEGRRFTSSSIL